MPQRKFPFNLMVFPNGPLCNLNCEYCYYLDKIHLYPDTKDFRMEEALLEEFTKQYVEAQPGPAITFGWQGGEPTLRGLDFFRKAVRLQKEYVPDEWQCHNSFQTNGVLLDDEWCEFLKENDFLVGISVDGPASLHDVYRKDKKGRPSHERVMRGLHLLQQHGVEFNVLCVVNDVNARRPLDVYRFFKDEGVQHVQFIPIVEHLGGGKVSTRSVSPADYGQFLITVFDEWVCNDLGDIFIQTFEECVAAWMGLRNNLCVFSETCGLAVVMEHNGDVYSCDHFVFPEYLLGNIKETHLLDLVSSRQQQEFGLSKRDFLPEVCRRCEFRFICSGGCLRERIVETPEGRKLNYLCAGYKQFFGYVDRYMKEIAKGINNRQSPLAIRQRTKALHDSIWNHVARNDPCPCGSGKKYKKCCMARK